MSENMVSLRHKITNADDLGGVVRSMKTMASSNISQYENAVAALDDYYRTVQLGLTACLLKQPNNTTDNKVPCLLTGVIVFGSDQGLVGQFNDIMSEFVVKKLKTIHGEKILFTVGERVQARLIQAKLNVKSNFSLPNTIDTVSVLVGQILMQIDALREQGELGHVYVCHHHPQKGALYQAVCEQLLPIQQSWQTNLANVHWPTNNLPQTLPNHQYTFRCLIREYLFVSLYRACAESLASENSSRLAAMQRAQTNIEELKEKLSQTYNRLRQSSIDEELFDIVASFLALKKSNPNG